MLTQANEPEDTFIDLLIASASSVMFWDNPFDSEWDNA